MTEVKTELASVEEHEDAVRKAIERGAYELYERDGFRAGNDQDHWFRAEREIAIQDVPFSIENGAVMVRLAVEGFSAPTILISISARSVLILSLAEDTSSGCGGLNRDLLRIISLQDEVDAARVTCELDDRYLTLSLPLVGATMGSGRDDIVSWSVARA
jgi:hypothetical protein